MPVSLVIFTLVFAVGLLLARQNIVRVALVTGLLIGILIAGNAAGSFVHNLLDGAWRFVS